jgi:antigen flippase
VETPSYSPTPTDAPQRHTYGQILKSSLLIGGSSVLEIGIGIIRTKANALLLAPAGFGIIGIYGSILSLGQSIAGMGVNSSGVREIAAAVGSGDTQRVARTAAVLRRASVVLGLLGALSLFALARPVSKFTFDSYDHVAAVALLSLGLLFEIVSDGQKALIQGLRRIPDLAALKVLGGAFGTLLSVTLIYLLRERGIALALVAFDAVTLLLCWTFIRRLRFETPRLSAAQVARDAGALLKLGFAFMASGMLVMGAAYAVRMMIVRQIGFAAAGLYQSAWTIGGLYVGFILRAMGADFYPRLTAVIRNRVEANRVVNEQTEVSLLLAGPGVLATLALAPLVIPILYSTAFQGAVELLRWLCLGVTLRVITWPMGFIIVAGGRQTVFLLVELAYTVVYVTLAWIGIQHWGLNGSGVAFFASYVFHGLLVYPVVRSLGGFRWSAANLRLGGILLTLVSAVFCGYYVFPPWLAASVGAVAVTANAVFSARTLARLVSTDRLPSPVRRLLRWLRLIPSERG